MINSIGMLGGMTGTDEFNALIRAKMEREKAWGQAVSDPTHASAVPDLVAADPHMDAYLSELQHGGGVKAGHPLHEAPVEDPMPTNPLDNAAGQDIYGKKVQPFNPVLKALSQVVKR